MHSDDCKNENAPTIRRTFHSCLEERKEIWQGPSRNDLISVGLSASHAIWLSASEGGPELKLASFQEPPCALPLREPLEEGAPPRQVAEVVADGSTIYRATGVPSSRVGPIPPKAIRTLKLPMSIHGHEISALALDDSNGVIALATTRSEMWLLDYAVAPSALKPVDFV